MKDSEVLECAIEMLVEEGWIQGTYYRDGEGYCSVGAVAACLYGAPCYPYTDLARSLLRAAGFPNPEMVNRPTGWQDATGRTKEEVIAALQKAVEVARASEEAEAEAETSVG